MLSLIHWKVVLQHCRVARSNAPMSASRHHWRQDTNYLVGRPNVYFSAALDCFFILCVA